MTINDKIVCTYMYKYYFVICFVIHLLLCVYYYGRDSCDGNHDIYDEYFDDDDGYYHDDNGYDDYDNNNGGESDGVP
jgi:hypothetical protein